MSELKINSPKSPTFREMSSWIYDNTCAVAFHRLNDMTENSNSEDQERRREEKNREKRRRRGEGR